LLVGEFFAEGVMLFRSALESNVRLLQYVVGSSADFMAVCLLVLEHKKGEIVALRLS